MATETITASQHHLPLQTLNFTSIPPFPDDIPVAPLVRLSLSQLRSSPAESQRFFAACQELGFFYLDLRGDEQGERLLDESDKLFEVTEKLHEISTEELNKYNYRKFGDYMGYKGMGTNVVDGNGNLDRNQFYNMPKDLLFGVDSPKKVHRAHHPFLQETQAPLLKSYVEDAHSLALTLLGYLESHLGLPAGSFTSLHRLTAPSEDHVRLLRAPPQPPQDLRTALGKHTDFGSVTILFNRIGGLQILPPPSKTDPSYVPEWTYVRPLPGHCVVNLGDAMTKFSGGILRSNIHRVVAPPGEQMNWPKYSLVYFMRPEDEAPMKCLMPGGDGDQEEISCEEWIKLQYRRVDASKQITVEDRQRLWKVSGRAELV